ncbi:biotin synthase BioB [Alkalimarinus sediminis]|uniref:Biotin synthase n=1 Tax=Alkalimarinus sediminis TaxID=1632866 RepID=A0A9E8KJX5_9ALTE|nr:biotin synthase BioB [Alkalimarinus sediminis]UZW75501.1 biotin synthase BioB [Alkalimarinus sediminis]
MTTTAIRHDWNVTEVEALLALPFNDLMFKAQTAHREFFDPNAVQISTLLSIKTGSCPEDCKYCPQSAHYNTGLEKEKLLEIEKVIKAAKEAKENGSSRFCMGAAWRNPNDRDMPLVLDMVKQVKSMGMETCMTLGMLTEEQADTLAEAGLDYYNHNLDTSEQHYENIITTRTYSDRLNTLANVRKSGMKVCSGGILGLGETVTDRAAMLAQLANMEVHPESVPINMLVKVEGTPLDHEDDVDPIEFVRTIAVARILMPASHVRLSAGREDMSDEMQALCFLAGANSIFYGCKLLTTANPSENEDMQLFKRLGIHPEHRQESKPEEEQNAALADELEHEKHKHMFYDAAR